MTAVVEVVSPAPRREWEELLATSPQASAFQSPQWTSAVCDAAPFIDVSRLYRMCDGRRLVLPLVRRRETRGRLAMRYSLPSGWGYGGLVSDGDLLRHEDIVAVWRDLRRSGRGGTTITPKRGQDHLWSAECIGWSWEKSPVLEHSLDLTGGFADVWQRAFRSSVRRAVRKAECSGVTVARDTTGRLIPEFRELYWKSVRRWAEKDPMPYPVAYWRVKRGESDRKFAAAAERMGDACETWLAYLDGRAVAGIIVLTHGKIADYWRGAMDIELAGPVRAADLLHKMAIEDACARGVETYSFGFTRADAAGANLARFKEGFGAEPVYLSSRILERFPVLKTAAATKRVAREGISLLAR